MFYTVYKITQISSGKIYIGVHKTLNLDDNYMGSGLLITRSIAKYGIEDFKKEYIAIYDNPEEMFKMESMIVDECFVSRDDTYNLKLGGSGGFDYVNQNLSTEDRLRITKLAYEPHKKSILTKYGVDHISRIPDVRLKRSNFLKKQHAAGLINTSGLIRNHTEETKRKIGLKNSIHQVGSSNSQYGTMWIYNISTFENKKISKDQTIPDGWVKGRKIN